MNDFWEVPPRIHYSGDEAAGKRLLGFGFKRLADLKTSIDYGQLDIGKNKIKFNDGSIVETEVCYGMAIIRIHVPPGGKPEKLKELVECFCNCNFSTGFVLSVIPDTEKLYDYLNIKVCNKNRYVQYDTVIGTDFVEWQENQRVWVIPYYQMQYDCTTRTAGTALPTGCKPAHEHLLASGIPSTPDDADWRPVYRVIPVCGDNIKEWLT